MRPDEKNGRVFRPGRFKLRSADLSFGSARLLHELGLADLLLDRALEIQRAGGEHVGLGFQQILVEAAIVVDALERVGRDAQAHVAGERVRDEGDVDQVRQEAPLGLDVRVAHLVAHLGALGRQFAAPGHLAKSSSIPAIGEPHIAGLAGVQNRVHFQEPRTYRGRRPSGQGFWARPGISGALPWM